MRESLGFSCGCLLCCGVVHCGCFLLFLPARWLGGCMATEVAAASAATSAIVSTTIP